ncbi:cytochrome c peroxidase [Pontibacter sp. G13]|uniref:cytochrome-c peroxidase n=1 Tax=Pontibacter sp. G13 TaxID=3074898 RepID=UPI002889E399|nr:cytochrome c peroxidase [Pontibacter sp. G13]WNJ20129.1 cytochrome c peroxidase [Pontibacter sp. G13]
MFRLLGISMTLMTWMACSSCGENPQPIDPNLQEITLEVPDHFPAIPTNSDNPLTQAKIDLGKKLFYDPMLSIDGSISCGSCHLAANGFADPSPVSEGVSGRTGSKNAMAIQNLAYAPFLFWDGRAENLEEQALLPIQDHLEMAMPLDTLVARLSAHPTYPEEFAYAFGGEITARKIGQAIASFEKTMLSYNSKFDRFRQSEDSTIFTELEWKGYKLFFDETPGLQHPECFHCHGGFNFDDARFLDNGIGFAADPGRYEVTQFIQDYGKFKVPTLRNIEHTAPYMHDGSFPTLESVLDHYQRKGLRLGQQDPLISAIYITEEDKAALIAFLKTLSDPDFLQNPDYLPD